jgi:hypothetical protein
MSIVFLLYPKKETGIKLAMRDVSQRSVTRFAHTSYIDG